MSVARHREHKVARRRAHALRLDTRTGERKPVEAGASGPSLKAPSARKAIRKIARVARRRNHR